MVPFTGRKSWYSGPLKSHKKMVCTTTWGPRKAAKLVSKTNDITTLMAIIKNRWSFVHQISYLGGATHWIFYAYFISKVHWSAAGCGVFFSDPDISNQMNSVQIPFLISYIAWFIVRGTSLSHSYFFSHIFTNPQTNHQFTINQWYSLVSPYVQG